MAMNKKERQQLEDLQLQLDMHQLAYYAMLPPLEPDVAPPGHPGCTSGRMSTGYVAHARGYADSHVIVETACSSAVSHGYRSWTTTSVQGARWLYSTPELAVEGFLRQRARKMAKEFAEMFATKQNIKVSDK